MAGDAVAWLKGVRIGHGHPSVRAAAVRGVHRGFRRVRPQRRGGRGGRTPTASHVRPAGTVTVVVSAHRSTRPAGRTPRRTPQRSHCIWPLCGTGSDTDRDAARVADNCCPQSGQRTGRCPPAQRPAGMTIGAAAEGRQRFRPAGGNGTGCRTPDRSRSLPAWHPVRPQDDVAAHRTGQDAGSSGRSIR
jgi:hypothetical protein